MDANTRVQYAYSESTVQSAIAAYQNLEYTSVRKCALAFSVPRQTLQHRLTGRLSRSISHEKMQNLSKPEERTLVRWITHLTSTGYPASPALVIEMAEEIRYHRYHFSKIPPPFLKPISKNWIGRFRNRHPEIQSVWARQIDSVRFRAMSLEGTRTWFAAIEGLVLEHQYAPECIYNMDESGFAVGQSETSRVLVNIREKSSWKSIAGRQEWITAIECVSAAGTAVPPLIIFKAKHTNTSWIPPNTPKEWRFSTSNSGWTSDSHAFEWITTVFEPLTRPEDPSSHRLLIMDGHGSHITANVISHCMQHAIDLLILPPHTSHMLQPLDVSIFGPLKRALAAETDIAARLDSGRIARVEWTAMYIRAREKALTAANIRSGWKATGLHPLSPITVLDKLKSNPAPQPSAPQTPSQTLALDLALLHSSPPDGTELRQANSLYLSQISGASDVPSLAKRYSKRMSQAFEGSQSENVILRKRLAEAEELLRTRKKRTTGKRIALAGKFVFSTEEVLQIAKDAERVVNNKKGKNKTVSCSGIVRIPRIQENILDYVYIDSESDSNDVVEDADD